MSRRFLGRIVLTALLVLGGFSLHAALANADSVSAIDATELLPSDTPALLGPINEKGRTGWECKPERAASAVAPKGADLPLADTH